MSNGDGLKDFRPLDAPSAPGGTAAGWYHDPNSGRTRWWDGNAWTERFAPTNSPQQVVVVQKGTNHILHLLLSIVTAGLWIPVWIIITFVNQSKNAAKNGEPLDTRAMLIRAGIALAIIVAIFLIVRLAS